MNSSKPTRLYVAVYLLILLVLAWQAGRWSHDRLLLQLNALGTDRLLGSISQMRRSLGQFNYLPFLISQNLQVRAFLRQPDDEHRIVVNRVLEQLNLLAGSTALFVLDASGVPLAFSNWRDQASVRLNTQRERDYFRQALAGEQGQELVWPQEGSGPAIMMSAPIYDGRLVGVAAMRVDLSRLSEQLDTDYPLAIVAPSGQPVLNRGVDWPMSAEPVQKRVDGTQLVLVESGGRQLIRQQVILDDLGWQVLVLTDTRPARQRELLVFFSVLGGGTAFGLLLLYLRESRQKRRIQRERMLERERNEERQRELVHRTLREANESLEQKVEARTRALEEAQAELVQAGKLAALGRMSASVVHELNQPMTAMRTYLAIAQRQLNSPDPDALARSFASLHQLLDRMTLITGQLKTFAYRKPERIEAVALQRVIRQVLQLFRGRIEEMQVQVHLGLPEEELRIAGDAARYEQVLINLIKNACDAMADQSGAAELWLEVVEADGQRVVLEVRDTGPGISPAHQAQIFEPFFTTKEVGQGLGLGLAIVHSILRDLGGNIQSLDVASGACFRLELPIYHEEINQ